MHLLVSVLFHQRDRLFNRQARHHVIITSDHRVGFEKRVENRFFGRFDNGPKHMIDEIALLDDLFGSIRQRIGKMLFPPCRRKRDHEIAARVASMRAGARQAVLRAHR